MSTVPIVRLTRYCCISVLQYKRSVFLCCNINVWQIFHQLLLSGWQCWRVNIEVNQYKDRDEVVNLGNCCLSPVATDRLTRYCCISVFDKRSVFCVAIQTFCISALQYKHSVFLCCKRSVFLCCNTNVLYFCVANVWQIFHQLLLSGWRPPLLSFQPV